MTGPIVQFDRGPAISGTQFRDPVRVIEAWDADDVPKALRAIEAARDAGFWLAGFAGYELGYALLPKLRPYRPTTQTAPLLQFGVFDAPAPASPDDTGTSTAEIGALVPLWEFARYRRAFDAVHEHLRRGDIYQANLTFPLSGRYHGTPRDLYTALSARQAVPNGVYLDLGGPVLLSRSPELFFSLSASGQLKARPMKGTARRGQTETEDTTLRMALAASTKNRAENLMIVDLLRNDLSRISEIGTVRVPKLFSIETYETLHQMTSEIVSKIRPGVRITDIFTALFPCGSITGAPKIRAMEILSHLETGPRGPYCGTIGWIAPNGAMEFNVAIRTLICERDGTLTLNVGGGVVYDSTAEDEYAEALLKARFAESLCSIPA